MILAITRMQLYFQHRVNFTWFSRTFYAGILRVWQHTCTCIVRTRLTHPLNAMLCISRECHRIPLNTSLFFKKRIIFSTQLSSKSSELDSMIKCALNVHLDFNLRKPLSNWKFGAHLATFCFFLHSSEVRKYFVSPTSWNFVQYDWNKSQSTGTVVEGKKAIISEQGREMKEMLTSEWTNSYKNKQLWFFHLKTIQLGECETLRETNRFCKLAEPEKDGDVETLFNSKWMNYQGLIVISRHWDCRFRER